MRNFFRLNDYTILQKKMATGVRFLYKLPEKWSPAADQVSGFVTTWQQLWRMWSVQPGWGREKGRETVRSKHMHQGETAFSLWLWKSPFKGISSPPTSHLAYGVCYRWLHRDTAGEYLALVPRCSLPAGQHQPGLAEWADSSQLLCKRK